MAFGKIPRFSPSFSLAEAAIAARYLARRGEDAPVVRAFEQEFADFIGVKNASESCEHVDTDNIRCTFGHAENKCGHRGGVVLATCLVGQLKQLNHF